MDAPPAGPCGWLRKLAKRTDAPAAGAPPKEPEAEPVSSNALGVARSSRWRRSEMIEELFGGGCDVAAGSSSLPVSSSSTSTTAPRLAQAATSEYLDLDQVECVSSCSVSASSAQTTSISADRTAPPGTSRGRLRLARFGSRFSALGVGSGSQDELNVADNGSGHGPIDLAGVGDDLGTVDLDADAGSSLRNPNPPQIDLTVASQSWPAGSCVSSGGSDVSAVGAASASAADAGWCVDARLPPSPVRGLEARVEGSHRPGGRRRRNLPWGQAAALAPDVLAGDPVLETSSVSAVPLDVDVPDRLPAPVGRKRLRRASVELASQEPTTDVSSMDFELARQLQLEEDGRFQVPSSGRQLGDNGRSSSGQDHHASSSSSSSSANAAAAPAAAATASAALAEAAFIPAQGSGGAVSVPTASPWLLAPRSRMMQSLSPVIDSVMSRISGPSAGAGARRMELLDPEQASTHNSPPPLVLQTMSALRRRQATGALSEEEQRDLNLAMLLQYEEAQAAAAEPSVESGDGGAVPAASRRRGRQRGEDGGVGNHGSPRSLRRRLLSTDRDFTPEDYELLLRLDEQGSRSRAPADRASAARRREEQKLVVSRLPVRKVAANENVSAASGEVGSTGGGGAGQCSICLDPMKPGAEIRTLPCLHSFHRKCIDRWLLMPGGVPRCPVDQVEIASGLL